MQYIKRYDSPIGELLLAADDVGLTGLWIKNQRYFGYSLDAEHVEADSPVFDTAFKWLDIYFLGRNPGFLPPIHMIGSEFRKRVWEILLEIPYGQTVTYGSIAERLAAKMGRERMSAQAVGGAVGHNEISIIIPCHRVVGANGSLVGYAGGIDKKIKLLELEKTDMSKFFLPSGAGR